MNAEGLLSLVDMSAGPEACWPWTGHLNGVGYGLTRLDGVQMGAHRAVYVVMVGPIPPGLDLDHLCRNRGCVNPAHLEPVTRSENNRRSPLMGWNNGYKARTACANGHPFDEANTYMRPGGGRQCRRCGRERARARNAA